MLARLLALPCLLLLLSAPLWANDKETVSPVSDLGLESSLRPQARMIVIPNTRWTHKSGHAEWTKSAMIALRQHGRPLTEIIPRDIANWCPAYPTASPQLRAAFWVGFMSALAKHESTYRQTAVGGGGLWYGLLQILPATARGYGCRARSGEALKNGGENLSCAVRIMAVTVPRDGVVSGKDRKWRGVAADWGPMRSAAKRRDIANWTRAQSYCKMTSSLRPIARPSDRPIARPIDRPVLTPKDMDPKNDPKAPLITPPQKL